MFQGVDAPFGLPQQISQNRVPILETASLSMSHDPPSAAYYDTEFRSFPDDAWYSVRLVREGDKLRIKYYNFSDDHDHVIEAHNFKSVQELGELKARFRPVSVQLQDHECSKAVEGMVVCVYHKFGDNDYKFYDAIIEAVEFKEHSFPDGEEECQCSFLVFWQHGPNVGNLAEKKVADICIVQSNVETDSVLASFLEIARMKIESDLCNSVPISSGYAAMCPEDINGLQIKHKSTYGESSMQCIRKSVSTICPYEERISDHHERFRQDTDMGGVDQYYIVLVENLDKELSPSAIVEFIHQQTSVSVQAYVFPSLSLESYTRGAIMVDCEKNLENLYEFLDNPNHIIVSSRLRPWVVTEKLSRRETCRALSEILALKSLNRIVGTNNELKVVCSGTKEYRTAKKLRDLYMEFADHQQQLHKRLAIEERDIHPSLVV